MTAGHSADARPKAQSIVGPPKDIGIQPGIAGDNPLVDRQQNRHHPSGEGHEQVVGPVALAPARHLHQAVDGKGRSVGDRREGTGEKGHPQRQPGSKGKPPAPASGGPHEPQAE